MKQLGALGVGRVARYVHPASSPAEVPFAGDPTPEDEPDEEDEERVAAVQAFLGLEPKYVGKVTSSYPVLELSSSAARGA